MDLDSRDQISAMLYGWGDLLHHWVAGLINKKPKVYMDREK